MLKCEKCKFEFSSTSPKSNIIANESCPRCRSDEVFVFRKSNPKYKSIIAWIVLFLFLSTILFPILW